MLAWSLVLLPLVAGASLTLAGRRADRSAPAVGMAISLAERFVGLVLMFAAAMLITVTATTLLMLLMAWEVMGAMSWALIGYQWREPARVAAAHVAFLTTRAANLGLYLAAGAALAGRVGSLSLVELAAAEVCCFSPPAHGWSRWAPSSSVS